MPALVRGWKHQTSNRVKCQKFPSWAACCIRENQSNAKTRTNKNLPVTLSFMILPFCQVVINCMTQVNITVAGGTMYIMNAK